MKQNRFFIFTVILVALVMLTGCQNSHEGYLITEDEMDNELLEDAVYIRHGKDYYVVNNFCHSTEIGYPLADYPGWSRTCASYVYADATDNDLFFWILGDANDNHDVPVLGKHDVLCTPEDRGGLRVSPLQFVGYTISAGIDSAGDIVDYIDPATGNYTGDGVYTENYIKVRDEEGNELTYNDIFWFLERGKKYTIKVGDVKREFVADCACYRSTDYGKGEEKYISSNKEPDKNGMITYDVSSLEPGYYALYGGYYNCSVFRVK